MGRIINHKFSDKEDLYIKENYLLIPRRKIAEHLKLGYNQVKLRMDQLGLVVPKEVLNMFKGTHKGVAEQKPKPEKKKAKKAEKSVQGSRSKVDKPAEVKFKIKVVDYSQLRMVKIDNKTWRYVPK